MKVNLSYMNISYPNFVCERTEVKAHEPNRACSAIMLKILFYFIQYYVNYGLAEYNVRLD
jgi:hypothetical protein